jgi:hypothetical protein
LKVADEALSRVRRSQPLIDNWRMSLDTAISTGTGIAALLKEFGLI